MSSAIKQIIENINVHKRKSVNPIRDNQITYIPTVEDNQIECQCFSYLTNGKRTILNQATQACFRLRYLKFKPMPPRKALAFKMGNWDLRYLVDNNVIYPFMLFVNGRYFPWDRIRVAIGQENYYLIIHARNDEFTDLIRDVKYAQIVSLPSHMVEVRGYPYLEDESVAFTFDAFGLFYPDAMDYVIRSHTDAHHIIHKFWSSTAGVNAFAVLQNTDVKLTESNVILFSNGLLATGVKDNIVRAFDGDYKKPNGYVAPCLEMVKDDDVLTVNPTIRFDSELLTIGNGEPEENVRYDFGVFINTKYTPTVDNINRTVLSALAPYVQDQNAGKGEDFLVDLQKPFHVEMDRTKDYEQNVADAIKEMLSYNASLFNDVYEATSNLEIEEWDSERLLNLVDEDGVFTVHRQHNYMIDERIVMLVNGELYKYNHMIKYKANKCMIPIQGIAIGDVIELLRFQNIIGLDAGWITLEEDTGFQYYESAIINNEMVLFSTETDSTDYTFPEDGLQHFPVDYSLETDEDGKIKITLANPFYYGKRLKVDYKNKFVHNTYHLQASTDPEAFVVDLGTKFMYCPDYTKYMVFYNGKRIGSDQFRLVLPVRTGTPFSRFKIYLTAPIEDGDLLDIMYVPSVMKDVILIPNVDIGGDIVIDKSILGYGLSTDLYMVWVNGKKVPKSSIVDIDSTHIRIITDVKSTKNVCITKYIADIDELSPVFKENDALWDTIMDQLTKEEIFNLLGITGEVITDTEAIAYEGVDIRTIMYELIREEFIIGAKVDTSGAFVYDYVDVDSSIIGGYDTAGNAVLPVGDSNLTDNLADVDRKWA